MSIGSINHIALATSDMDLTIRFWRDLLGLRLVTRLGQPGERSYVFQLPNGDWVVFFEWTGVEPVPRKPHHQPVRGPFIFDHISFGVGERKDLSIMKKRLEGAGFEVSEVEDHGLFASVYTHDPNGIPIEFSTNLPSNMEPILRDISPSEIALEGTDPLD
jgi:catechol 2,3-dioxygenase-like lactoylglutathione lyase family enzyme